MRLSQLSPYALWGAAILGALVGFGTHGVGGGIVGAPGGALAAWALGEAMRVFARPFIGVARTGGIVALLAAAAWLAWQLWDVGRP
ncbi:MAG: hypothetical protein U1E56_01795 [Bauldia sp.]